MGTYIFQSMESPPTSDNITYHFEKCYSQKTGIYFKVYRLTEKEVRKRKIKKILDEQTG